MAAADSELSRQHSDSPTSVEAVNHNGSNSLPSTPQGALKQRLSSAFLKGTSSAAGALSPFSVGRAGVFSTLNQFGVEKQRVSSSSRRNSSPSTASAGTMDNSSSSNNNDQPREREREGQSHRRLMATDLMADNGNNAAMVLLMRQKVEKELKERQKTHDKTSILEALRNINMFVEEKAGPEPEEYPSDDEQEEEEEVHKNISARPQYEKTSSDRRFAAAMHIKLSDAVSNMKDNSNNDNKRENDDESCSQMLSPVRKDTMQKRTSTASPAGLSKYINMHQSFSLVGLEDSEMSRSEVGTSSDRRASTGVKKKKNSSSNKYKQSQSMSNFGYMHDIESDDEERVQKTDEDGLVSTNESPCLSDADIGLDNDIDEDAEEPTMQHQYSSEANREAESKPTGTPSRKKPKGILKRSVTVTDPSKDSLSQSVHQATPTRNLLHSLYDGGKAVSARNMLVDPVTPQQIKKESAAVAASPSSAPTKRRSRSGQLDYTQSSSRRMAMGDKSMPERSSQASSRRLKRGEESCSRRLLEKKTSADDDGEQKPTRTHTPKGEEKAKIRVGDSPRSKLKNGSTKQLAGVSSPAQPERGRSNKDNTEDKKTNSRARSRSRNRDPRAVKRVEADTDEKEKKTRTRSRSRNRDPRLKRAPRCPPQNKETALRTVSDHSELSRGPRRSRQKGQIRKAVSDRHGMKSESALLHRDDHLPETGQSVLQFDPSQQSNISVVSTSNFVKDSASGERLAVTPEAERVSGNGELEEVETSKDGKEEKSKKLKVRGSIMKLPWMGKKSAGKVNSNE